MVKNFDMLKKEILKNKQKAQNFNVLKNVNR